MSASSQSKVEAPAALSVETLWQWDIYYTTHDMLKAGILEAGRSRVEVLASTYHDSWVRATEMVIYRSGFYITRTDLVI